MKSLEVYKYGTQVTTKLGCIPAIITGVTIRGDSVSYEISYFYEGEHITVWIKDIEFTVDNDVEKTKIGFKK